MKTILSRCLIVALSFVSTAQFARLMPGNASATSQPSLHFAAAVGYHNEVRNTNGSSVASQGHGGFEGLDASNSSPNDIVWSNGVWSWKPDSLAWNCWTNALACTNGARGDFQRMFVYTPTAIVRNPNFWLRRFRGWPAYSLWNNCNTNLWPKNTGQSCAGATTVQGAGVLVSPEHVLTAGHMAFRTNQWLAFMDANNTVVWRRVQDFFYCAFSNKTNNNSTTNMPFDRFKDYYIGLLERPVPDNIGYVKIVPTNWWIYFDAPFNNNQTNHSYRVPMMIQNCQHRTPVLRDLVRLTCSLSYRYPQFETLTLTNFVHEIVGGDSGSPMFLVLDGELCLFYILSSNLNLYLKDPDHVQSSINAAMRELSLRNGRTNIYALSVKDLSRFPTYHRSYDCP